MELRTVPGADHGHGRYRAPQDTGEDLFTHSLRFTRGLLD